MQRTICDWWGQKESTNQNSSLLSINVLEAFIANQLIIYYQASDNVNEIRHNENYKLLVDYIYYCKMSSKLFVNKVIKIIIKWSTHRNIFVLSV